MTDVKDFGKFIKEKRIAKKLTQKELADLVFVSESACSKWEIGQSFPDITRIPLLAKALGVTEQELITAADDLEYQRLNQDAAKWNNLVNKYFWIPTICYIISFAVCLICNIAINHTLSWSLTVMFSLLVAFSFIPTCLKFVSKHKLSCFCATTYVSMLLLFANCVIQYGGSWFWIAAISVLLGYFMIFAPFVLKKYNCKKYRKWNVLAYFVGSFILLMFVLLSFASNFKVAFLISLYCYLPLLIIGIIHVLNYSSLFKSALDVVIFIPYLYGLNFVINKLVNEPVTSLKVDFANWAECINGNIYFIISICLFCISTILAVLGFMKKKGKV